MRWNVLTVSLRQRIVPDRLLGRINASYRLLAWGSQPIGALFGGLIGECRYVTGGTNRGHPMPHAEPRAGHGVVLVAEDDEAIRQFACRVLRSVGYTVLEAADGDQAVLESQRCPTVIDVLVTDIVMPGMHGREVATAIRVARPAIAVVFMSGYADAAEDRDLALHESGMFLPKPFTVAALRDIVARAAGEHPSAPVS